MSKIIKSLLANKIVSGSAFLTVGQLLFNGVGYITTILMSRSLTVSDFGVLAVLSSFFFLIGIPAGALAETVQRYIAYYAPRDTFTYLKIRKLTLFSAVILGVFANGLYIVMIPLMTEFFNLESSVPLIWFAPVIGISFLLFWFKSLIKGHLEFAAEASLIVLEGLVKLAVIGLTFWFGWGLTGAIASFWVSIFAAVVASGIYLRIFPPKIIQTTKKKSLIKPKELTTFYFYSMFSQLGLMILVSVDIILVKHLVSPEIAGTYALLSIFGKIIILGATSLTGALTPIIASQSGTKSASKTLFIGYALLGSFILFSTIFFGLFSHQAAQTVLGSKGSLIANSLATYSLAVGSITFGLFTVQANIQQKRLSFAVIPSIFAAIMAFSFTRYANNTNDLVSVYALVSASFALTSLIWYAIVVSKEWIVTTRNEIDKQLSNNDSYRLLIFNWRDTKHVWSGGAEVYVHQLAKRFVSQGSDVLVFAGNDRQSKHIEKIEGVTVVRRGGFYSVYLWAAVYYALFFRKKFNVLIDCENGIPFFTPLYSSLPKFLVVHHIHQEVFREHLPLLKAKFAQFLEGVVMPFVYKDVALITVSESSREELNLAGIIKSDCQLVHNGVDLENYSPGKKSKDPLVLYVGRLKAYKSIDILIKAADVIKHEVPTIKFVIAGYGEEEEKLKNLVKTYGLTPYFNFTGKISESDKREFYKQAWVVVNPSFMEGFGITSIEANASGTVMVAADVPGLRDSVKDGYSGILVPYGNVKAFAEAITHLVKNKKMRIKMEKYALSWSKRFSWDKSQKELDVLISSAIKERQQNNTPGYELVLKNQLSQLITKPTTFLLAISPQRQK